jgi:hypothetical protein
LLICNSEFFAHLGTPHAVLNVPRRPRQIYLTQKMDQDAVQNIAINDVGQDYE